MLRKAARLFRSLNFPCAATASTCEDSPCFQVFGVNLFHVIAKIASPIQVTSNSVCLEGKRFASRFEACMLIFTHSCVLSVVVVVSTIMVIIVLSFFITVVMISEMVSLNDVMSKCIFDLFLLPEVMGWEVGLIEVIAFIYFIGPCLSFLLHFLYYVFNSSFLSIYRGLDTRLCCGLLLAHGHLECTVEEAMPPHFYVWQMNAWYSLVILSWWMFWFSFDIVVSKSTLSLLCEDTPAKPQSLHWWRRICSMWWQILVTCI